MKKNLLIITQKVDENDDLLGFFTSWIREFAARYDKVTVITLAEGKYVLPKNVRVLSLGKEAHTPKWRQTLRFIRLLWCEVRLHNAVFAHMSPIFAIAAWPFTVLWHKKLVLWYLHRSRTPKLRLALAMVDTLVTADKRSLTVQSPKIVAVGHGIDVERFTFPNRLPPEGRPLHILSVGRLSPIKGFETLIRATAELRRSDIDCDVRIVGKAVMPGDREYEEQLHILASRLGVADSVHFFGFVPYHDMPIQYRWADIFVGCTPPGGIDKALLEAMASGCIVITSNQVMKEHLGADADKLLFTCDDAVGLSEAILRLDEFPRLSAHMSRLASGQTTRQVAANIMHYL